jgi:hypothetical protein
MPWTCVSTLCFGLCLPWFFTFSLGSSVLWVDFLHSPHVLTSRPLYFIIICRASLFQGFITRYHSHSSMSGYFVYHDDKCHQFWPSLSLFVIHCRVLVFA